MEVPPAQPVSDDNNKSKIVKTNEEFKQHEETLMQKRVNELNNLITQKCHLLWNEHLSKIKPLQLAFTYSFDGMATYLAASDRYISSEHKDSKQKWWNNQKASEMSHHFLPSALDVFDQMAQTLASHSDEEVRIEFANVCMFELLETAITAVFSTSRSGSNEIFLRTAFQYSKSDLRRKLMSYFTQDELSGYSRKQLRKKETWRVLVCTKKQRVLAAFGEQVLPAHPAPIQTNDQQGACTVSSSPHNDDIGLPLQALPSCVTAHSFHSSDSDCVFTPRLLSQLPAILQASQASFVPSSYQAPFVLPPDLPPLPPLPVVSFARYHPYASVPRPFTTEPFSSEVQAFCTCFSGYSSHRCHCGSHSNQSSCTGPKPQPVQMPDIEPLSQVQAQTSYHDQVDHETPDLNHDLWSSTRVAPPPPQYVPETPARYHQNDQCCCNYNSALY